MTAAADTLRRWKHDPASFVRDNFKVEPDAWQLQAMAMLKPAGINRLCMKACAGPGKTAMLAWLGWWGLACHGDRGQHPKGIAVSITADNLKDNLWPELAKWQRMSPFLIAAFEWQRERIFARDHPETWFMSARSFRQNATPEEQAKALSGLHSEFVVVLIDESGGMPTSIGRAAEQALGNCRMGMVAQAGNPLSVDGLLYHSAVNARARWSVIDITGDPDDPNRSPRVSIEWAREQIAEHGRDNPWVQAYILGKFPTAAINSLLSAEDVTACLGIGMREDTFASAPKIIGCDVARFGDDRTVIWRRQGLMSYLPDIMRNARTDEIAAKIVTRATGWADATMVDGSGGYGAGVVDALHRGHHRVHEVYASGKASDPQFFNKRAEMWWKMAAWVKRGAALPNLPDLVRELSAPVYWLQDGKLRLEEKDQIKKRLGCSPDLGDGLAHTFAFEVAPRGLMGGPGIRAGQAKLD